MSIYEKGSVNIWEVIVVVVFTSVLFISGMYVWTNYRLEAKKLATMPKLPQPVTSEYNSYKLRFSESTLSKCTAGDNVVFSVMGKSRDSGRMMTFDQSGAVLTAGSFGAVGDSAYQKIAADFGKLECEILSKSPQ